MAILATLPPGVAFEPVPLRAIPPPLRAMPPPRIALGLPVLPFMGCLLDTWLILTIVENDYCADLALAVDGVVSYDTTDRIVLHKLYNVDPPEQSLACHLCGVWTGIPQSLRIIDWEHTQEQLWMVFIKALIANLQVCVSSLDRLEVKSREIGPETATVAEPECPFTFGIRDAHLVTPEAYIG
jgi:hypothetical protein